MIKTVCVCDRCGQRTEDPVVVTFAAMDILTREASEWTQDPGRLELCEACAGEVSRYAARQESRPASGKSSGSAAREKIDTGKVIALRTAGWKIKDIAEEMGLAPGQVSKVLCQEKKRREQEAQKAEG